MYKATPYTHALGDRGLNDVLAVFSVGESASRSLRIEAVTADAETDIIKLQHSVDEVTWTDVKASAEDDATTHTIIINLSDTTLIPLKPKCRIISTGTATFSKVVVCKDN